MNMEADRYFGEVSPPDLPIVRLYTWDKPTISFGWNQNPAKRIDLDLCRRNGIPVVQRPTGGRELLHGHDLCYCAAMPYQDSLTAVEARKVFSSITDVFVAALTKMGLAAKWHGLENKPKTVPGPCFAQIDAGEIAVGGGKLVASAQRVFDHCIIQEGSIPLHKPSIDLIDHLCLENKESLRQMMNANTAYLSEKMGHSISADSLALSFKQAFADHYSSEPGPAEEHLADFQRNNQRILRYY
jgi:lipoate-protein ligase A